MPVPACADPLGREHLLLLFVLWERAVEATNLCCLIPHFSQCFKKHPWLTEEEGVWRPNASGLLSSLEQSIRERASADVRAQELSLLDRALLPESILWAEEEG